MVTPNLGAGLPELMTLPGGGPAGGRRNAGNLFVLALLKAGREGCTCESCRLLKQIEAEMEKTLEAASHAGAGHNPQP